VIYFTGVPSSNNLQFQIKEILLPVAFAIGIWPSWSMFAPNPIKSDSQAMVEIQFKNKMIKTKNIDGSVEGFLSVLRHARWMKYAQDNLISPDQKGLLEPAMFFYLSKYQSEENPITSIKILHLRSEIPPFSEFEVLPKVTSHQIRKVTTDIIASLNFEN
jgi:hypothetical protein